MPSFFSHGYFTCWILHCTVFVLLYINHYECNGFVFISIFSINDCGDWFFFYFIYYLTIAKWNKQHQVKNGENIHIQSTLNGICVICARHQIFVVHLSSLNMIFDVKPQNKQINKIEDMIPKVIIQNSVRFLLQTPKRGANIYKNK